MAKKKYEIVVEKVYRTKRVVEIDIDEVRKTKNISEEEVDDGLLVATLAEGYECFDIDNDWTLEEENVRCVYEGEGVHSELIYDD